MRHTHLDADTPDPAVAFHSGGLYGVLLGAAIFALLWPLRHRFRRRTTLLCAVVALYAAGRFVEAFFRLASGEPALGLSGPQWTSVALLLVAGLGALWARRRYKRDEGWSSTWGRPMLRAYRGAAIDGRLLFVGAAIVVSAHSADRIARGIEAADVPVGGLSESENERRPSGGPVPGQASIRTRG